MKLFKKIFYKTFNKKEYKRRKEEHNYNKMYSLIESISNNDFSIPEKNYFSIKHSGHTGDIIYSIPIIKALARETINKKINFFINLNEPSTYDLTTHPNGNVILNDNIFNMLKPLLESQTEIFSVLKYENNEIDFDLDDFRQYIKYLDKGSISKWYQYLIPLDIDLSKKWLDVTPNYIAKDSILINRTSRYNVRSINYSYLKKYKSVYFVGLENEYKNLKMDVPNLEWIETKNFLELAQIIAGAKLFIGNQSSPFAIAEALKVTRILETDLRTPNVITIGGRSIQCCMQNRLEFATDYLYNGL